MDNLKRAAAVLGVALGALALFYISFARALTLKNFGLSVDAQLAAQRIITPLLFVALGALPVSCEYFRHVRSALRGCGKGRDEIPESRGGSGKSGAGRMRFRAGQRRRSAGPERRGRTVPDEEESALILNRVPGKGVGCNCISPNGPPFSGGPFTKFWAGMPPSARIIRKARCDYEPQMQSGGGNSEQRNRSPKNYTF